MFHFLYLSIQDVFNKCFQSPICISLLSVTSTENNIQIRKVSNVKPFVMSRNVLMAHCFVKKNKTL